MVLIDTSVWIDHFRGANTVLEFLLNEYEIVTHPFVLGELACGNFKNRHEIFELLSNLPSLEPVSEEEYFIFIEKNKLFGLGLGFVDIHLLAASIISNCKIYAKDKYLHSAACKLDIVYAQTR